MTLDNFEIMLNFVRQLIKSSERWRAFACWRTLILYYDRRGTLLWSFRLRTPRIIWDIFLLRVRSFSSKVSFHDLSCTFGSFVSLSFSFCCYLYQVIHNFVNHDVVIPCHECWVSTYERTELLSALYEWSSSEIKTSFFKTK